MDRSTKVKLVSATYTVDSIGQRVPTETQTEVYASISSVSYNEWHQAGQNGIKPEYRVRILNAEYSGQSVVILNNVRYFVYRTYIGKGEVIDLYLEKRAGI